MKAVVFTAVLMLTLGAAAPSHSEPVSITAGALTLTGRLETVSAKGIADGVVLIVHGTLAHHGMEIVSTLQDLLAEQGHNTLAVTLSLGVSSREGMYDCALPHRHRHQDAVSEIGRWLDWLATRGAGPVTLVGHSRGGNQVARAALVHAGRIHRLALIAPGSLDPERAASSYEKRHGAPLEPVLAKARDLAPDAWLDGVGFLHCRPARVTAGAFVSYYSDDGLHDTYALLGRIGIPTLVVAGSSDVVVGQVAEQMAPHLDDDTRLVMIDGAGHFFRDLYAEDLADAIAGFLESPRP